MPILKLKLMTSEDGKVDGGADHDQSDDHLIA